eukprot:3549599-Prymnesium_polylepis.1
MHPGSQCRPRDPLNPNSATRHPQHAPYPHRTARARTERPRHQPARASPRSGPQPKFCHLRASRNRNGRFGPHGR